MRNILDQLDSSRYYVINGPVLRLDNVTKEYDHIVIGLNGIFILETKAFGMTNGKASKAALFIDAGDKWILRKNGKNKELTSPSLQVKEECELFENIISCPVEVHSVLVLSNPEIILKQNIDLPYSVIRIDNLRTFIENYNNRISESDRMESLTKLNKCRVN